MNRPFTLPVVIACSAHALLMFGFRAPERPPVKRPAASVPTKWIPFELPPKEPEKVDRADIPSEPSGGKPAAPRPMSEDHPVDRFSADDLLMDASLLGPVRVSVETTIISPGPASLEGDPHAPEYGAGNGHGPIVYNATGLDSAPHARVQAPPVYPFSLKATGISGEVWVEFVVDEHGRVTKPRVVRSTHADFEAPTLAAVSKWRFEPGTRNMAPVSFRMLVPVTFNLNE